MEKETTEYEIPEERHEKISALKRWFDPSNYYFTNDTRQMLSSIMGAENSTAYAAPAFSMFTHRGVFGNYPTDEEINDDWDDMQEELNATGGISVSFHDDLDEYHPEKPVDHYVYRFVPYKNPYTLEELSCISYNFYDNRFDNFFEYLKSDDCVESLKDYFNSEYLTAKLTNDFLLQEFKKNENLFSNGSLYKEIKYKIKDQDFCIAPDGDLLICDTDFLYNYSIRFVAYEAISESEYRTYLRWYPHERKIKINNFTKEEDIVEAVCNDLTETIKNSKDLEQYSEKALAVKMLDDICSDSHIKEIANHIKDVKAQKLEKLENLTFDSQPVKPSAQVERKTLSAFSGENYDFWLQYKSILYILDKKCNKEPAFRATFEYAKLSEIVYNAMSKNTSIEQNIQNVKNVLTEIKNKRISKFYVNPSDIENDIFDALKNEQVLNEDGFKKLLNHFNLYTSLYARQQDNPPKWAFYDFCYDKALYDYREEFSSLDTTEKIFKRIISDTEKHYATAKKLVKIFQDVANNPEALKNIEVASFNYKPSNDFRECLIKEIAKNENLSESDEAEIKRIVNLFVDESRYKNIQQFQNYIKTVFEEPKSKGILENLKNNCNKENVILEEVKNSFFYSSNDYYNIISKDFEHCSYLVDKNLCHSERYVHNPFASEGLHEVYYGTGGDASPRKMAFIINNVFKQAKDGFSKEMATFEDDTKVVYDGMREEKYGYALHNDYVNDFISFQYEKNELGQCIESQNEEEVVETETATLLAENKALEEELLSETNANEFVQENTSGISRKR